MDKVIIFGAGGTGQRVYRLMREKYEITGFTDNDATRWGQELYGVPIVNPNEIDQLKYDYIALGTLMGYEELQKQLERMEIPAYKIIRGYVEQSVISRIQFLKRFAEEVYRLDIPGSVGEAGVFRGEFAKEINSCFPDRSCYLFDTFEGFDSKDIEIEKEQKESLTTANYMKGLSEHLVYEKMPNKSLVKIFKGYFPDTASGIKDAFCFVNLDMDLYQPTLEGLKFFYPKLARGGVILIHDYFSDAYPNLRQAVADYENETGARLAKMPIGDDISIAITRV